MSPLRSLSAFVLLALPASAASAQTVLDDFEDDDVSNAYVFSETDAGITAASVAGALEVSVDPAAVGDFIGVGVETPGGSSTDASDADNLTVPVAATSSGTTSSFSVVVNLQEDADGDGAFETASEDEFQAFATVTVDGVRRVLTLPLDGFSDVNGGGDGVLDRSQIRAVVFVVGAPDGLGDPFTLRLDAVAFAGSGNDGSAGALSFNDFEDGGVDEVFPFSGADANAGITVDATDGAEGSTTGAAVSIDPGATNGFVGFGFGANTGVPFDATGAQALTFSLRAAFGAATNPFTLIVKLVEAGDGEDEFEALASVSSGTGYALVSVPISQFSDSDPSGGPNDGFDLSQLQNIVFVIAGTGAIGDPFTLSVDEVAFAVEPTATPATPRAQPLAMTLGPNPTAGRARVALILPAAAAVRVDVFDVRGRLVATALRGLRPAGPASVDLDTGALASGLYAVRVTAGGAVASQTLRVVR